jgi:NAD(P)-dependent dehydrogenase (short-subunit alcohol dehydrogenase family)
MADKSPLIGKVALVTGAAAGIGKAITERLLADGASVVGGDIDEAGLALLPHHDRLATLRCDVTSEADQAALVALAVERFGGLDIAVANAGRGHFAPIVDHELSDWQSIMDLCVNGVFLTIKHAGQKMRDGGSIVTIASLNAVQPSAGMSAYCTAKAAVAMLTKVAAMELGGRGIRVNAVAPGLVETAATGAFFDFPPIVDEFVDNTTVGRFAQPSEIAAAVAFLAGNESTFISGPTMLIDGGASTGRYPNLPKLIAAAMPPA